MAFAPRLSGMLQNLSKTKCLNRSIYTLHQYLLQRDITELGLTTKTSLKLVPEDVSACTDFVVSKSPEEWKWVERLLVPKIAPEPTVKDCRPSGWKPADDSGLNHPYFLRRTKNHMLPVYLVDKSDRMRAFFRKYTLVKNIQGDIWALEKDLRNYVQSRSNKPVFTQVHEVSQHVKIKGDHFYVVEQWAYEKGF